MNQSNHFSQRILLLVFLVTCYLGVTNQTQAQSSSECEIILHHDIFRERSEGILISDILKNDTFPADSKITFDFECGNILNSQIRENNAFIEINYADLTEEINYFCYTVSSCSQTVMKSSKVIIYLPVTDLCEDDCDLLCEGDFEDFMPAIGGYFDQTNLIEFYFSEFFGSPLNSPDIFYDLDDNRYLGIGAGTFLGNSTEGIYYPLDQPIPPNSSVTVSFRANATQPGIVKARFFAHTNVPCDDIIMEKPLCFNSPSQNCPDLELVCMTDETFPGEEGVPVVANLNIPPNASLLNFDATDPTNGYPYDTDLGPVPFFPGVRMSNQPTYTFDWTNNTGEEINHIMIYIGTGGNRSLMLDDISVELACESICNCSNTIGQGALVTRISEMPFPETTNGQCVEVYGTLIIDEPLQLTNQRLSMQPGSQIIVSGTGTLDISSSELSACDRMWRGIKVEAFGSLTTKDNTIIKDAQYAIQPLDKSNLNISSTNFVNNYISVYTAGITTLNQTGPFVGNNFTGTNLKLPYWQQSPSPGNRSYAAIYLNKTVGLDIGDNNFASNTISRLRNGIIAYGSILHVENVNILNTLPQTLVINSETIQDQTNLDGNSININSALIYTQDNCEFGETNVGTALVRTDATITNSSYLSTVNTGQVHNGILSVHSNNSNIEISDNEFVVGFRGIFFDETLSPLRLDIERNIMRTYEDSSTPGLITVLNKLPESPVANIRNNILSAGSEFAQQPFYGIGLGRVYSINVDDNNISDPVNAIRIVGGGKNLIQNNSITNCWTGLRTSNSIENNFCCNTISSSGIGMDFYGICSDSKLEGNVFANSSNGLVLNEGTEIGLQSHNGNRWQGTFLSAASHASDDQDVVSASRFFVDLNDGLDLFPAPPPTSNGIDWFFIDDGNTYECVSSACEQPILLTNDISESDQKVMEGLSNGYFPAGKWQAERNLLFTIDQSPSLFNFDGVHDFYQQTANEIHQFNQIYREVNDLFKADNDRKERLVNYYQEAKFLKARIQEINATIQSNIGADNSALEIEKQETLFNLQNINDEYFAVVSSLTTETQGKAFPLINENDNLDKSRIYESNEKIVNDIYLKILAENRFLTSDERSTLETIAKQCPLTGGNAVFQARIMIGQPFLEDDELCQSAKLKEADNTVTDIKEVTSILPNPANDRVSVYTEKKVTDITIIDFMGNKILTVPLNQAEYKTIVLDEFKNGIYFFTLMYRNHPIHTEKIIVLKDY